MPDGQAAELGTVLERLDTEVLSLALGTHWLNREARGSVAHCETDRSTPRRLPAKTDDHRNDA